IVGTRVPRLDGKAKATGEAKYSIDVRLPGMLYGRILRCPHPAATVKTLDLSAAKRMPGVRAVLGIAKPGGRPRLPGQEVAAVAAEAAEEANDGVAAIQVCYDARPFVVALEAARKADAPLVFEGKAETKTSGGDVETGNKKNLPRNGNVLGPRASSKGDV